MRNLRLALVAVLGKAGAQSALILDSSLYIEDHSRWSADTLLLKNL